MIGEATLVPPKTSHPDTRYESKTSTPVFGSASAETSAMARRLQCAVMFATLDCQLGCDSTELHPLPAPLHADSTRGEMDVSDVPPTAVTKGEAAGYCGPKPLSPELAVMATPG